MNQNRTIVILIGVVFIMGLMVVALGALAGFLLLRQPLGASLDLQPTTAPPATIVAPASIQATLTPTLTQAVVEPTSTPTTEPQAGRQPICGASGTMSVLFTGADYTLGEWPFGADAVRVVKVDFDQKKITVVAFPRDLVVQTAGLSYQNMPETPLGLAYYYRREATRGTDKARTTAATTQVGQALYDTFGIAPQAYITLQLDSFSGMIDTLEGVEVNNPVAFTSENGMKFPAGKITLNGYQSREYVRSYVQGDAARIQRQNIFARGVQNRILSLGLIMQAPELVNEFSHAITTDLSPSQLISMACMLSQVPPEQVDYYEIGGDLVTLGQGNDLLPKIDRIKVKLAEWIGN